MAPKTKIHMYLEIVEDHYTAGVAKFSQAANYRLFGLMANVRNDGGITPVSMPKGFPTGLSKGSEEFFKEFPVLHSKTWLDLAEMETVADQLDGFAPGVVACIGAMKALVKKGSNPRLIVAFED